MSKLLTVVILILSHPLFAVTPSDQDLILLVRKALVDHCDQLDDGGIHSIGGIPIQQLKQKAQTIKIKPLPKVQVEQVAALSAVRRTAFWEPETDTIWISARHIATTNFESVRSISSHELYRSVGISDENF